LPPALTKIVSSLKAGIEGILVPSAIGRGKNLVIYTENLSSKSTVSVKRRRKMEL